MGWVDGWWGKLGGFHLVPVLAIAVAVSATYTLDSTLAPARRFEAAQGIHVNSVK